MSGPTRSIFPAARNLSSARRRYTPKLKAQVVLEVLEGDRTPGQVVKAYGVHPNLVGLWKRRFVERPPEIFAEQTTVNEFERRIRDLEQLLGKKEVEMALVNSKDFLGRSG